MMGSLRSVTREADGEPEESYSRARGLGRRSSLFMRGGAPPLSHAQRRRRLGRSSLGSWNMSEHWNGGADATREGLKGPAKSLREIMVDVFLEERKKGL